MKLIRNNILYIQKKDLIFLQYSLDKLPKYIKGKFSCQEDADFDSLSEYAFIPVNNQRIKFFIQRYSTIIDFDDYIAKTVEELEKEGEQLISSFADFYGLMTLIKLDDSQAKEDFDYLKGINHKMEEIADLIAIKNSELEVSIPEKTGSGNKRRILI